MFDRRHFCRYNVINNLIHTKHIDWIGYLVAADIQNSYSFYLISGICRKCTYLTINYSLERSVILCLKNSITAVVRPCFDCGATTAQSI